MQTRTAEQDAGQQGSALARYFVLCFVLAWSVWIPAGLLAPDAVAFAILGAWAPTLAALLLTGLREGREGLRRLLRALLKWRVSARYYVFAVAGVPGVALLAVGLHVLLGGSPPGIEAIAARFGIPAERADLFIAISPLVFLTTIFAGGPVAEELGWRGYAQPRLQARLGAGRAGLAIGFLWSLWHLPLFYFFPSAVAGLPLRLYVPLVAALGVLFAWLYNRTGGSVLLCILLHAGVNFALGAVGADLATGDGRLLSRFVALLGLLALALYLRIRTLRDVPSPAGIELAGSAA